MNNRLLFILRLLLVALATILVAGSAHGALQCEPSLLATDTQQVGIVLLGGGADRLDRKAYLEVEIQIRAALPSSVHVVKVGESQLWRKSPNFRGLRVTAPRVWVRDWFPGYRVTPQGKIEWISLIAHYDRAAHSAVAEVARLTQVPKQRLAVAMDWGNVIIDERGVLISSFSNQLIRDNEDFEYSRKGLQQRIISATGAVDAIWLPGLPGEGTGHVDMFVSYLGKRRVFVADSREPIRKAALDQAASVLITEGYQVTRIMNAGSDQGGLNMTYTNSLLVNGRVLVPVYSKAIRQLAHTSKLAKIYWKIFDAAMGTSEDDSILSLRAREIEQVALDDKAALELYASKGFEVYPIYMNDITVSGGGSVHCLTRCIPKVVADELGL